MTGRLEADDVRRGLDAMGVDGLLGALGLLDGAKRQTRGRVVCCPHHAERTPSCSVQDRDGRIVAHCFACEWKGSALDLVAEARGIDARSRFPELLAEAAALAGVYATGDTHRPRPATRPAPSASVHEGTEALGGELFAELVGRLLALCPVRSSLDVAAYLDRRGVLDEAERAGWGALPEPAEQWRVLADPVDSLGADALVLWARSGLGVVRNGRAEMTMPEHRILIPYRSPDGRIVGLKRRAIGDGRPKYVNTKGRPLAWPYGVEAVAGAAADVPLMFVEGEIDALDRRAVLRQAGAEMLVLGVPGVSSWRQEWAAYAKGRNVAVALDADEAGEAKAGDLVRDLYAAGAVKVERLRPRAGKDWNARTE